METPDYYRILGIDSKASSDKVKESYRDLAFKYHPDRNEGNPTAAEKMKQINEAYAVLSNSEKRREYDALRSRFGSSAYRQFRKTYSEQDIFSQSDIHQVLEEMAQAFGFRGSRDIFKEFYGTGYRTFKVKRPEFFFSGFIFSGRFGKGAGTQGQLPSASGPLAKLARHAFQRITGVIPPGKGKDINDVIALDMASAKKGGPYAYFHERKSKKLVVKIPPGVRDGQKIRLAGMGAEGKGGGAPGDLYLRIRVKQPLLEKLRHYISR
jgi:DnaJ-class molecular chaperone